MSFDTAKNKSEYDIAICTASKEICGRLILLRRFLSSKRLLAETKLQNITYANNILTLFTPALLKLYTDSFALSRCDAILSEVCSGFSSEASPFALAGYDVSESIALHYTKLAYQHPASFSLQSKPFSNM